MDLEVKGFIETSFLDWDGQVVSTAFVPRCNFRCPFCHNLDLIDHPDKHKTIPFAHIEKYLVEHKDFIDGICLTGGEPALHKELGLFEFLRKIKQLGFKIKFDTNGTDPDLIQQLLKEKLVDHIAMDIKGPLDERYQKLAGVQVDLDAIKQSIAGIIKSGLGYEFRTTVVPTLLDTQDIEDIAREIAGAKKYVLQQFVPANCRDAGLRSLKPYSKEELEKMAETAGKYVSGSSVRGV
jgi:pyruvate formate lyase activating enzyme